VNPHNAESSPTPQVSVPTFKDMVVLAIDLNSGVDSELVHRQIKQLIFDQATDMSKS